MTGKKQLKKKRKNYLKIFILIGLFFIVGAIIFKIYQTQQQTNLSQFYKSPNSLPTKPGILLKYEKVVIPSSYHTSAYRILYTSQHADGTLSISSGMIYIPNAFQTTRPIIAWAHGTLGMGENCAPSRTSKPYAQIGGFSEILEKGWIIVATDYSGLGTDGIPQYLIGKSEAYDLLNSVRAAKEFPEARANNQFALWGLSQGGHAVLFAAQETSSYAPELRLIAAAAAAPATELISLMNQQYNTAVGWAIGPEVAVTWPSIYPDIQVNDVLSSAGIKNYERLAYECILPETLESIVRNKFGEDFFAKDPTQFSSWQIALTKQTPQPVMTTPLLIVQSQNDTVVPPNITKEFIKKSCDAGSNITVTWLNNVSHMKTALVAGPEVAQWLQERFEKKKTIPSC